MATIGNQYGAHLQNIRPYLLNKITPYVQGNVILVVEFSEEDYPWS